MTGCYDDAIVSKVPDVTPSLQSRRGTHPMLAYVPSDRSWKTLDSGEVASLPKRWAMSLSGGKWCSYPILLARANICDNDGVIASSETPLSGPLRAIHHCEYLLRVLVLHCKGLFRRSMYIDGRAKAGKIRTHSINVWSFRSFWVRITTHRYFLSSGSDCPRTNCSLINCWRSSGELCG